MMSLRLLKLVLVLNCIIVATHAAQTDGRGKKVDDPIDAIYKQAVLYRDGMGDVNQDPSKAKKLFKEVVKQNPKHAGAHHNLGLIAYNLSQYVKAKASFKKAADLGFDASSKFIWRMIIAKEVQASDLERFLAICDFHGYPLPMRRESLEFDYQLITFKNSGHREMEGAMYTQEFSNDGYLSVPIIWVENPEKFKNTGKIVTKLLVVGTQRIMDLKS
jgi:tetratricopeptide (TPR) repeat protein